MTILSDRPSETVGEDLLGLEGRLSAVLDILRHRLTQCPITVAIYGDWGTGKTSAMHWLEGQLQAWNELGKEKRQAHPCVYPVWFDPWKYQTREEVWRGIISEVILALFDAKNLGRQNFVPRMKEAARKFGAFLGKGFLHALANTEVTLKGNAGVPGTEAGSELKLSGEMFREIYEEFDRTNHPEKAYLNQFEDTLKSWVKSFLQDEARIALFIDDLDRCLPDVTLEVLEAIKLYLNIPQIIFVVGLDRSVVDSIVRKHYADQGLGRETAEKYLDKIFQVEIQVSPSQTQMADFHQRQIKSLDESTGRFWGTTLTFDHRTILEKGISELARDNPRELKRLLNSALLRGRAAADNPILCAKIERKTLFTQGVQFFLVQKVVEKWFGRSSNLLLKTSVLNWFKGWSDFVQAHPDFRPKKKKAKTSEEESSLPSYDLDEPSASEETAAEEFKVIRDAPLRHDDGKAVGKQLLFDDELLWQLLLIPFSAEVGQSAPNLEPPKVAATASATSVTEKPDSANPLAAMPDVIRGRIAQVLEKSVDQLTLADLSAIKELDLSITTVEDADLVHLKNFPALENLELSFSQITGNGLSNLENLKSLRSLDLGHTKLTETAFKSIQRLPALQSLFLNHVDLSNIGIRWLEKFGSLQILDLWYTGIEDKDLESLGNLKSLRTLGLANTNISDAGLKSLENLASIEMIDLSGTKVTDGCLSSLAKFSSLKLVDLMNTKVTASGVKNLQERFPGVQIDT